MQIKDFISATALALTDLLPLGQSANTRKTTLQDVKNLFLGTATLNTTDKTVNGAINENKANIGDLTTLTTIDKSSLVNAIKENTAFLSEIVQNPRCQYSLNNSVSLTTEQHSVIGWDKKIFDNKEFITTDNTTITIKESGLYLITLSVEFDGNINGVRNISILKDNVEVIAYDSRMSVNYSTTRSNVSAIQYLNSNETLKFRAFQNSGNSLNIVSGNTKMSIAKIGGDL
ncbi:hypothetical protein [Clostridium saccharoperbutylacetonicum]|uniref:hypothetical protein n=1 Tax=Clostridium saccharoperbutylacetonicum TaxID=36745 RepID=UPI0039EC5F9A